jgi:hypothetical protein
VSSPTWIERLAGEGPFQQLAEGLAPSDAWSVMLAVAARRATRRRPRELREQWERDRFVCPGVVDQRTLRRIELLLLEAASTFEALELSPLAPLGVCSALAPASQNKIVSTTRGSEVVADPTNVLALECARRLSAASHETVRLCTCHRVVRAQPAPRRPGFAQHFSLFALASATRATADHGALEALLCEHIATHLAGLDALRAARYRMPVMALRLLAHPALAQVAARIGARFPSLQVEHAHLDHPYYDGGLRFMLSAPDARERIPLIDGGAFGWVARLSSNRRHLFVASGFGHQLVPILFAEPP